MSTSNNLHARGFARFLQRDVAPADRESTGLQGVLRDTFPLLSADRSVLVECVSYELSPPACSEEAARRLLRTYAAVLKVTARLYIFQGPVTQRAPTASDVLDIKEQELYFGDLPLLTARGTWIASGVEQSPLLRVAATGDGGYELRAVDALYAETFHEALGKVFATASQRLARVMARGEAYALMPHDVFNVAPIQRAWATMIEKSPFRAPTDTRSALARAAQVWRVYVDDDARGAFSDARIAPWLTRDNHGYADLSPDAPVADDGTFASASGDGRSLLRRLIDGLGAQVLRVALPVDEPDALPCEDVASALRVRRHGARVVAPVRGRVASVHGQRVWLADEVATVVALRPREPEHLDAVPVSPAPGDVVEAGDPLVDGAGVRDGVLAPGRWCSVAHDPSLALSRCRVSSAAARALGVTEEVAIVVELRSTPHGVERLTATPPDVDAHARRHLDASGLVALGAVVAPGDILVGRATPTGGPPGGAAEVSSSVCAREPAVVVSVDIVARPGVEPCTRQSALTDAAQADLDAESEEHAALLSTLTHEDLDGARANAQDARAQERWSVGRGVSLPSGVAVRVRVVLRVTRALAAGDMIGDLSGRCWTVDAVEESLAADITQSDARVGTRCYALRIGPSYEVPPAKKSAASKRAPRR